MTGFSATPEQAAAIEHPLADACVVAGAGSGKTTVLTQRFLHLVREHGVPLRRIAALTFTEKAAAQMRDRIGSILAAEGRHAERDDIEFAPISTIHAFCARLLRLHAVEAGVDPGFGVLDDAESRLLKEDALVHTLRRLRATGDEDFAVLGRIAASPSDLLPFLEDVRGAGTRIPGLEWHRAEGDAAAAHADVERALATFEEVVAGLGEPLRGRARTAAGETRAALVHETRVWRLGSAVTTLRGAAPDKGNGPRPYTTSRKELVEALERLRELDLDAWATDHVAPALVRLVGAVDTSYRARKLERGALDFTDLEREALGLLEGLDARGRRLAHAPLALLVDEYQDTNPLQARLLDRVRGPSCPQFSVGDPKQSIYRFRGADVRVIQAEHDRVGAEGQHLLQATFRARPPLVDCLNGLHASLLADGFAGVEHVPMRAAGRFRDADGPDVEFVVVDAGGSARAATAREDEARWIASAIRELVASGATCTKVVTDARGNELPARPIAYGDIAMLFRARTSLTAYEDALADAGIPFHTHKGRGYFRADEIGDLLHVLRVVHDPADVHAFAAMATGPVLGAEDADLLRWCPAGWNAKRDPGVPWERFRAEARLGGPFQQAAAHLERLRREAVEGRVVRVVEGVLHDLGLLEAALLQPDGARRAANLRKTVALARRFEADGHADLSALLRRISILREREIPEAEAAIGQEGANVVRLNTVHGAKGLEYPLVILADAGRRPGGGSRPFEFDEAGSFAARLRDPLEGASVVPGGWRALHEHDRAREEEESRRLLYVATTRAEERLWITGWCLGRKKSDGNPKSFTGWGAAVLDAVGGRVEKDERIVSWGAGRVRVRLVDPPPPEPTPAPVAKAAPPSAADHTEAARVLARARQPVAPLGMTPYVVTVTDLLRFASSPSSLYESRLAPEDSGRGVPVRGEPDDPAAGEENEDPQAGRREDRRRAWDEPAGGAGGLDRAALGRALHLLLERADPRRGPVPDPELHRALAVEFDDVVPAAARELLREMEERFRNSDTGHRMAAALDAGLDVRREVAFHARIRFPRGMRVGPFGGLLVRGSIDLWLPQPDGVWVVDHKTNAPGGVFPTLEAVRTHYAWQLRLYALAAERLLDRDVAGARLLLLDPGWGEAAAEVEVDVRGDALEDARRLCFAYARAELESRWPADWRGLLDDVPPRED